MQTLELNLFSDQHWLITEDRAQMMQKGMLAFHIPHQHQILVYSPVLLIEQVNIR
jgi:hypothetical protein